MKVAGQLIFTDGQPATKIFTMENPSSLEMVYNLNGNSQGEVGLYAGVYQYAENPDPHLSAADQTAYYQEMVVNHTQTYQDTLSDAPIDAVQYRQA
jgi:hypothetical protein